MSSRLIDVDMQQNTDSPWRFLFARTRTHAHTQHASPLQLHPIAPNTFTNDISPQVPCHLLVTFYHHLFSHFDISSCAARTLSFSSSVTDCFSLNLPTFQRRHTAPRDAIGWMSSKGVAWLASTNSDVTSGSVIGSSQDSVHLRAQQRFWLVLFCVTRPLSACVTPKKHFGKIKLIIIITIIKGNAYVVFHSIINK